MRKSTKLPPSVLEQSVYGLVQAVFDRHYSTIVLQRRISQAANVLVGTFKFQMERTSVGLDQLKPDSDASRTNQHPGVYYCRQSLSHLKPMVPYLAEA